MDLKELESGVDPKTHWYYQSKKIPLFLFYNKIFERKKKPLTLIDFGAGSGFFALELLAEYPNKIKEVLLVDIGYSAAELEETPQEKVKKLHFIPHGIEDSIVIMMDVLEHIEDDYAILDDIISRLGKNAYYFITVPAFMSMWSGHDVYLEHFRRYTLSSLRKLATAKDFKIHNDYYIYGSLFPFAWLFRRIKRIGKNQDELETPTSSDMSSPPSLINSILKLFNSFEMNFRKLNKLFGITVVSEGKIK